MGKSLIIKGLLGILAVGGIASTVFFYPIEPIKIDNVEQVKGEVTQESTLEAPEIALEAAVSPTPPVIKGAGLYVPKTDLEQDTQIDQNTIRNIEQDGKLSELDNRVTNIEQKDWCSNLDGVQPVVPMGYTWSGDVCSVYVAPAPAPTPPTKTELLLEAKIAYDMKVAGIEARRSVIEAQMNKEISFYDNYNQGQIGSEAIARDQIMKIKQKYAPQLEPFALELKQAYSEYQLTISKL